MVELRLDNLGFNYNKNSVLSGVNTEIHRGEVVSIVGRNGAGKSTMLKCINRILHPDTGTACLQEKDISDMNIDERARKFGYLSQKNEHLFPVTVFEVVLNGRYPHSPVRFTKKDEEIAARVIRRMGLDSLARRNIDRLSGGEQQQVMIARALAQGAEVMLFDEPTNNLDLKHQLQIMRVIRDVAVEQQITSVIAIHDLNIAAAYSDKVVMLHKKNIYASGKPEEVLTKDNIKEVFGVNVKIYDHHGIPHIVMLPGFTKEL